MVAGLLAAAVGLPSARRSQAMGDALSGLERTLSDIAAQHGDEASQSRNDVQHNVQDLERVLGLLLGKGHNTGRNFVPKQRNPSTRRFKLPESGAGLTSKERRLLSPGHPGLAATTEDAGFVGLVWLPKHGGDPGHAALLLKPNDEVLSDTTAWTLEQILAPNNGKGPPSATTLLRDDGDRVPCEVFSCPEKHVFPTRPDTTGMTEEEESAAISTYVNDVYEFGDRDSEPYKAAERERRRRAMLEQWKQDLAPARHGDYYVSWWPGSKEGLKSSWLPHHVQLRPAFFRSHRNERTYAMDVWNEEREPDIVLYFPKDVFDVRAMLDAWKTLATDEDALYKVFGQQCSSISMQVLRAGMKGPGGERARELVGLRNDDEVEKWHAHRLTWHTPRRVKNALMELFVGLNAMVAT